MYFHVHHTMIHNDKAVPWEFGRVIGSAFTCYYSTLVVRLGVLYVWVYC